MNKEITSKVVNESYKEKDGAQTITIPINKYRWRLIIVALVMFGLGRFSILTS